LARGERSSAARAAPLHAVALGRRPLTDRRSAFLGRLRRKARVAGGRLCRMAPSARGSTAPRPKPRPSTQWPTAVGRSPTAGRPSWAGFAGRPAWRVGRLCRMAPSARGSTAPRPKPRPSTQWPTAVGRSPTAGRPSWAGFAGGPALRVGRLRPEGAPSARGEATLRGVYRGRPCEARPTAESRRPTAGRPHSRAASPEGPRPARSALMSDQRDDERLAPPREHTGVLNRVKVALTTFALPRP
jgi:hypothetical protein